MKTPMRTHLARAACCGLLLAAFAIPAGAESGMRPVTDPSGRYTISFPSSWEVVSMNASPVAGEIVSQLGKNFMSMLMAVDPGRSSDTPTLLMVMGLPLETAISPRTFGMITGESMNSKMDKYAVVKEGTATIAKRPAFYRYFTVQEKGHELYAVMVYFTVGKTGYMIIGMTPNQPEIVQKSFGDISRILETFRPTSK